MGLLYYFIEVIVTLTHIYIYIYIYIKWVLGEEPNQYFWQPVLLKKCQWIEFARNCKFCPYLVRVPRDP